MRPTAKVGTSDVPSLRKGLFQALLKAAVKGDVPAAREAKLVLAELEADGQAEAHREHLAGLAGDSAGMAEYLGELGLDPEETEAILGQRLDDLTTACWQAGQRRRLLELRAVERFRVGRGGEIPAWMRADWDPHS